MLRTSRLPRGLSLLDCVYLLVDVTGVVLIVLEIAYPRGREGRGGFSPFVLCSRCYAFALNLTFPMEVASITGDHS